MPNNLKLEFKNNLPDLSKGLDAALSWLTPFNLPPDASYVTILALEELATHAINHGYPDNLEHLIHVEITVEKNQLFIQYLDDGVFFQSSRCSRTGHESSHRRSPHGRAWHPPAQKNRR